VLLVSERSERPDTLAETRALLLRAAQYADNEALGFACIPGRASDSQACTDDAAALRRLAAALGEGAVARVTQAMQLAVSDVITHQIVYEPEARQIATAALTALLAPASPPPEQATPATPVAHTQEEKSNA
jgi:hypothetical protein